MEHMHIYETIGGKIIIEFRPKKPKDIMMLDKLEKKKNFLCGCHLYLPLKNIQWLKDGQTGKPFLRISL